MDVSNINLLAVLVATLSTFLVGWIWYGPLFGKAWINAVGFIQKKIYSRGTCPRFLALLLFLS